MSTTAIFPFEYFSSRITLNDVEDLRQLAPNGVHASLITGRCGSTLFAAMCRNARFGVGDEPFIEREYDAYADFSPAEVLLFLRQSMEEGSRGGRFYFQVNPQRYHALRYLFVDDGLVRFIDRFSIILRRNIVAQALSFATAAKSGVWHLYSEKDVVPDAPVVTDAEMAEWILHIHSQEAQSFSICAGRARALVLFYEDIVAAPIETLELFLRDAGVGLAPDVSTDMLMAGGTLKNPQSFDRYLQFMESYPVFHEILAERMRGLIPTPSLGAAVERVRKALS
jgi:hypothetical protein